MFEKAIAVAANNRYAFDSYIAFLKELVNVKSAERAPKNIIKDLNQKITDLSKLSKNLNALNPPYRRHACGGKQCRADRGRTGLMCACGNMKAISLIAGYPFKQHVIHDKELLNVLTKTNRASAVLHVTPFPPPPSSPSHASAVASAASSPLTALDLPAVMEPRTLSRSLATVQEEARRRQEDVESHNYELGHYR